MWPVNNLFRYSKACLIIGLGAYLTLFLITGNVFDLIYSLRKADYKDGSHNVYLFKNGEVSVIKESDALLNFDLWLPYPSLADLDTNAVDLKTAFVAKTFEIIAHCNFDDKDRTNDGSSWRLCPVGPFSISQPCFVLSFGKGINMWDVEKTLANQFKCHVLALDPTVPPTYQTAKHNLLFLREGLHDPRSADSFYTNSFINHLKRLKADNVLIDALKFDIGDSWLHVVESAMKTGSLRNVKQLLLAVPILETLSVTRLKEESRIIYLLRRAGFRLWFHNVNYRFHLVPKMYGLPSNRTVSRMTLSRQLHFINVDFLTPSWPLKNNEESVRKVANPLAQLPIVKLPGFHRLAVMRRINLSLLSSMQLEELYYELVQQLHVHCPRSMRIGDPNDGGWDVCFSGPFNIENRHPCVAFSFGIDNVYDYDDQLADEYNCKVYMFDPSMGVEDYRRRRTSWFFNLGLAANNTELPNGWKMRDLCTLFDSLGYADKEIDILKIDIEFWEWETLEKAMKDGCLVRVRQILLETHTAALSNTVSDYARYIRVLMGLFDLGFANWHSHLNKLSAFSSISGVLRPCCYEHYLVNTKLI